jgi:hypothetical protein
LELFTKKRGSPRPDPPTLKTGNYDSYVQTRAELEENQMKKWKWEQEQVSDNHICFVWATEGHRGQRVNEVTALCTQPTTTKFNPPDRTTTQPPNRCRSRT